MTGALAAATCAYLTGAARRSGQSELAGQFRNRALGAGIAAGLIAAVTHEVLLATAISMSVGAAILIPSLTWLYTLFQRAPTTREQTRHPAE